MTLPSLADVLTAALPDHDITMIWLAGTESPVTAEQNEAVRARILSALLPQLQAREQTIVGRLNSWDGFAHFVLAEATPEAQALTQNDLYQHVAEAWDKMLARVSSLTAEREALKVDRDALMDRVSDMIDEREALQEALAKAKRTKP